MTHSILFRRFYNRVLSTFAILAIASFGIQAQEQNAATLDSLTLEFDVHRAELMKPIAELKQIYQEKLNELLDEVTAAGDLKKALAVKAEITDFASKGRTVVDEGAFPELKRLEEILVEAQAQRVNEVNEKMVPLIEVYQAKLKFLQKRLTQEKKLEEAVRVQSVLEKVEAGISLPDLPALAAMEKKGVGEEGEESEKDMMIGKTASFAHSTQTDSIIDVKFERDGKATWVGLGGVAVEWAYSVGETPLIYYFWSPSQGATKDTGFKLELEADGKAGTVTKVRGGFPVTEAKISRSRR
ncbi:MAG: hypothetical protein KDN20_05375 [Verrucomicrobiae bacterium]|nr:hypothetical protein [Verrucomicrobiae bacterium]